MWNCLASFVIEMFTLDSLGIIKLKGEKIHGA